MGDNSEKVEWGVLMVMLYGYGRGNQGVGSTIIMVGSIAAAEPGAEVRRCAFKEVVEVGEIELAFVWENRRIVDIETIGMLGSPSPSYEPGLDFSGTPAFKYDGFGIVYSEEEILLDLG
jgi:hypothetical protein